MAEIDLQILTPEKQVFEGSVASLGVVTSRGVVEVYPGHAEMVSVLDIGCVQLRFPGDFGYGVAVHGGIMRVQPGKWEQGEQVESDRVQILAGRGEHPEEIDIERAEAARERAIEALGEAPEQDMAVRALHDRLRAETRIGAFKSFKRERLEDNEDED